MFAAVRAMTRPLARVALVAALLTLPALTAAPALAATPEVYPITARVQGQTYGQWAARWWKWALEIPKAVNPLDDPTGADCSQRQHFGNVWFLAGTTGGSATRTCTIPSGKSIFMPVINIACWIPFDGANDQQIRDCAVNNMNAVNEVTATVDGVPVPNAIQYRARSGYFYFTGPSKEADQLWPEFGQGGTHRTIADGYWLFLKPLPPGPHTVSIRGAGDITQPDGSTYHFETTVTYHLTVQ